MKCPHCGTDINIGKLIGTARTARKASASKANGAKGGRPPKPTDHALTPETNQPPPQVNLDPVFRQCQSPGCLLLGSEQLVHSMKAWLCQTHA